MHAVSLGVEVGSADWQQRLETNKQTFAESFVQRDEFTARYPDTMGGPEFVNEMFEYSASIPDERLAPLVDPSPLEMLFGFPLRLTLDTLNRHSNIRRALMGSELPHDERHVYTRNLEVPAGGGVGTARAIARAYSVFATGGKELGLREETLRELTAPAIPPARGFHDEVMKGEVRFSLGFMKSGPPWSFGSPASFGAPGAGGSLGFADPQAQVGYAYVPNRKGTSLTGDPREIALRDALYSATPVAASSPVPRAAR